MANVPIYTDQGGSTMTIGADATLVIEGAVQVAGGGSIEPGPNSITTAMIQDDAVTTDKIADDAVTTDKIADANVTTAKLALLAVDTGALADDAVTFDKSLVFISESETGTGAPQNIAHGLGVVPQVALFMPIDTAGTMTPGTFTITPGMHTGTDIVVTATNNLVFQVMAWG